MNQYFFKFSESVVFMKLISSLLCVMLFSACSGSSGTVSPNTEVDNNTSLDDDSNQTPAEGVLSTDSSEPTESNPSVAALTRVTFKITVPAYVSDSLQVRLVWGDLNTTAQWVVDESWTLSTDLSTDTENRLVVTLSDNNGAITLGSFATNFRTGTSTEQTFSVSANQFNTSSWDDDGDGVSNLDELIAGDNPEGNDVPESTQATLELVPDKTFRLTWSSSPSADYYRVLENPDGVSGFTAVSGNLAGTILSYDHRVALFKRTNAQYRVQACNNVGCADSEILSVTGTLEQGIGYFKAPNAQGGVVDSSHGSPISFGADHFGASVKLSADGNTLVMGAANEDSGATGVNGSQDDDSVIDSGAVYVFARIDNQWELDAYIKASNTDENDNFGAKLSLSDDGNTLAVGVYNESSSAIGVGGDQIDNSAYQSGAVYVFARSNGAWVQQSYIKASNAEARDQFGLSLDISGDGNTLVVGARYEDGSGRFVNSATNEEGVGNGAAYVYTRSGEAWSEQAYLKSNNSDTYDNFGSMVAISGDGNTIAVVANGEASISTGINADDSDNSGSSVGAVYVFTYGDGVWKQEAYVKGSTYRKDYNFGRFSIDLNDDGNTLAVGVWTDSNLTLGLDNVQSSGTIEYSGSVYVFTRTNSQWQHQAFLKASNVRYNGLFGSSVSLSGDGNTLAVGSIGESSASIGLNGDQNNPLAFYIGAAYVFERSGESWQQKAYVKASNTEPYDGFSGSINLSHDGNSLAIGARSERSNATTINGDQSDNSAPGSGAVYLY